MMDSKSPPPCILPIQQRLHKEGSTFKFPPLDGTTTIPELFDWHFVENADYPVFVFKEVEIDGLKHIYYRDFIPAIHEAGWHVAKSAGICLHDPSFTPGPIAILATTDTITYCCTILGMLRAGIPVVPISPMNTADAVARLLEETDSRHLLVSEDSASHSLATSAVQLISEHSKWGRPRISKMPTYANIFQQERPTHRLPERTYDLHSPAIYVHSSGSTSLPTPVIWTHAELLQTAASQCFGTDLRGENLGVQGLSISHASGINHTIPFLCVGGYVAATLAPEVQQPVRTPEAVMQSFLNCHPTVVVCVPSYLEAWAKDPKAVQFLKTLKAIAFGGGPLSKETGDWLVKEGVPLSVVYGSTEANIIARYFPDVFPDDWEYFEINPQCSAEFAHVEGDLHELIIVKTPTQALPIINSTYNGLAAYTTNDLLQRHPTKPGFWKIYGRADDQITLVNGLKMNAGPIESVVSGHPVVRACIMFGRAQRNVGILVFPVAKEKTSSLRSLIWPTVEKLNESGPKHAHIFKEMILVADASKPELLTEKGTIRRGATLSQYADEIKKLYHNFEGTVQGIVPIPTSWDIESTTDFVRSLVSHALESVHSDDQDIFNAGCASLQAFWISNSILHAIGGCALETPRNFIYERRTISLIAKYTSNLALGIREDSPAKINRGNYLSGYVKKFTETLGQCNGVKKREDVVILTGTTGALGSCLLARLVVSSDVHRVYALNRASANDIPLMERQRTALRTRGLNEQVATSPKVCLLEVDFKNSNFGLSEEILEEMRMSVSHVIHCAWPVNFNLQLNSFLDMISGTRALVDLALSSKHPTIPKFLFISSLGLFRDNTLSHDNIPEDFVNDGNFVFEQGYSESKWISEQMLAVAARRTTLRPTVFRVDQITGASNGAWNTNEWFPVLLRTGVTLGFLPLLDGLAHWISLEIAAAAILECRDSLQEVLHIKHPRPVPLKAIINAASLELGVSTCPYGEWIRKLEERAVGITEVDEASLRCLPALKAMDFFRNLQTSNNEVSPSPCVKGKAIGESSSLSRATSITDNDVHQWILHWKEVGLV